MAGVVGILGLALAGCHAASAASPATSATDITATVSPNLSVPGTHRSTTIYRIASPVSTIVVISHLGNSTVVGGRGPAISVAQQAAYSRTPPVTSRTISGRTLILTCTCPPQLVCGVAYVVQVPREVAVQATVGAGSIRLTGIAGSVTAKADVGHITAAGLTGDLVSLTTGAGGISATFTAAPAMVEALTKVGAITVRVPSSESYRVSVYDHFGKAMVSVRRSSSAPHAITAGTDVGAVLIAPLV
jgi:hypothetical protein